MLDLLTYSRPASRPTQGLSFVLHYGPQITHHAVHRCHARCPRGDYPRMSNRLTARPAEYQHTHCREKRNVADRRDDYIDFQQDRRDWIRITKHREIRKWMSTMKGFTILVKGAIDEYDEYIHGY